jgi:hypothetical protein
MGSVNCHGVVVCMRPAGICSRAGDRGASEVVSPNWPLGLSAMLLNVCDEFLNSAIGQHRNGIPAGKQTLCNRVGPLGTGMNIA